MEERCGAVNRKKEEANTSSFRGREKEKVTFFKIDTKRRGKREAERAIIGCKGKGRS